MLAIVVLAIDVLAIVVRIAIVLAIVAAALLRFGNVLRLSCFATRDRAIRGKRAYAPEIGYPRITPRTATPSAAGPAPSSVSSRDATFTHPRRKDTSTEIEAIPRGPVEHDLELASLEAPDPHDLAA